MKVILHSQFVLVWFNFKKREIYLVIVALRFSTRWFSFSLSPDSCSRCSRAEMTFCINLVTCSGPWLSINVSNSFPEKILFIKKIILLGFLIFQIICYQYLLQYHKPLPQLEAFPWRPDVFAILTPMRPKNLSNPQTLGQWHSTTNSDFFQFIDSKNKSVKVLWWNFFGQL